MEEKDKLTLAESMITSEGNIITSLSDKIELFFTYYKGLYESQEPTEDQLQEFFDHIKVPMISEQHRQGLYKDFNYCEVEEAIQQMKLDKSPGFDRLPAEFYKTFRTALIPYIQEILQYCFETGELPATWREAKSVLIPKKERDTRFPEAYHPISMLNTDYKILASMLANRLSGIIGEYVTQDQTGFIPGRYLKEYIITVINITTRAQMRSVPTILFYLDAEKVFDQLDWKYSQFVIQKFGIGFVFSQIVWTSV